MTIHVLDTQPPSITASLTTGTLWPPDHSLINAGLSFGAADVASVNAQANAARAQCTGAGMFVVGDGPVIGPKQ